MQHVSSDNNDGMVKDMFLRALLTDKADALPLAVLPQPVIAFDDVSIHTTSSSHSLCAAQMGHACAFILTFARTLHLTIRNTIPALRCRGPTHLLPLLCVAPPATFCLGSASPCWR